MARWLLLVLALLTFAGKANGAAPEMVRTGIYVQDVYDLDPKTSSYSVFFYLWFRWKGPIDPSRFELMNGTILQRMPPYVSKVGDENYLTLPIRARLHGHFNYSRYPHDNQELEIVIEDSVYGTESMAYSLDEKDSNQNANLELEDYQVGKLMLSVETDEYKTNWGQGGGKSGTNFSRFHASIPIRHGGSPLFLKTYMAMFIATAIGFLCLLIPTRHVEALFVIGVGSIFGVVSSWVVYSNSIPASSRMSSGDMLHLASLLFVFMSLAVSCIGSWMLEKEDGREKANKLARRAVCVLVPLYVLVSVGLSL